jgi:hypothetical protein
MVKWTEGRLKSFITSIIRSGFRKYPEKYECLNAAKVGKKINTKTGRLAEHYKCNHCGLHYPAKDVQVDHVAAVVDPKQGFVDWDVYIKRMYVGKEGLQVLCSACHTIKTNTERQSRCKKKKV